MVHGGDLLYRSKVPAGLVEMALSPLQQVAASGIPVFLVPGNHERSAIPYPILTAASNIHIFDYARSFTVEIKGVRVMLAGFPYHRKNIRRNFRSILNQTGWVKQKADLKILCLHHCFEGARVGPSARFF